MALTKIETQNIEDGAISTPKLGAEVAASVTLIQSVSDAANLIPAITSVNVANSNYDLLDDTAVSLGGGYIVINGTGFSTGAQVLIDGTVATSVTRVSSTQLQVQVPAKTAASYNLYVVNNTGHTAIKVNGLTYSANPTWVTGSTLVNQTVDVAFSVGLSATGAVSYANTTALPAGTALLSNGYFYGTVTGIEEETTYTFTVVATDAENQDSPRTFSVTVTIPPAVGIYSWGRGVAGTLGLNNVIDISSPVQIDSGNWINLAAGGFWLDSGDLAFGIKSNGTLWAWGYNNYGRLGFNDTIARSSPVQIGTLTGWSKVAVGERHTLAIKTNGTLWVWGYNGDGYCGLNDIIARSSPVQVGTQTWSSVSSHKYGTLAVKTGGTLWSWGQNYYGVLGVPGGITFKVSSPIQVGTLTNWKLVDSSSYCALATKTDGTLWSWGQNTNGVAGLGDTLQRSSPTQVGALTNWDRPFMSAGRTFQFAYALKTNGTLWAWGYNGGRLGLNDAVVRSSPTQIGTGTNWKWAAATIYAGLFIKTDGTLWGTGYPNYGGLGLNDAVVRSSPTQIGNGSNWQLVECGTYQTIGIRY